MEEQVEEQAEEVSQKYDLHIKIAEEMRQTLKDSAEVAYRLGETAKPDLVDLMSLFMGWGIAILKKKWLDRMGYK